MRRNADDDSSPTSTFSSRVVSGRRGMRAGGHVPALVLALVLCILPGACGGSRSARELHIIWTSDVRSLDPNQEFEFASDTLAMNVFEPLLRYDRKLSFSPVLAERWEIAEGGKWQFHLRPGVKFHDGTPLTADDVVFTVQRIKSRPSSGLFPYLSGVSSIRSVDPATVEVISDRPAGLLSILSFVYILPQHLLKGHDENAFFSSPIGTGPYRYTKWIPHQSIWLERFPDHRDPAPAFSRVVFMRVADRESMWREGRNRSPAILFSPSRATWKEHLVDPAFQLVSRPGITVQYLVCNLKPTRPLADRRVREALHAAIDYPRLTQKVSGGQSFPASQYVTADIIGFNPSLSVPVFENGKASRLLTEAGHPHGLDLDISYIEGPSPLIDELAAQLGQAGVRLKKRPKSSAALHESTARCEPDLSLHGWFCSTGDASELFEGNFVSSAAAGSVGNPAACGYGGPGLDASMEKIAKTLDPAARRDLLQQLMKRVVDDLPWIPLLVPYDRYALTGKVGWEPRGDGEIYLPDVKAN